MVNDISTQNKPDAEGLPLCDEDSRKTLGLVVQITTLSQKPLIEISTSWFASK